MILEEINQSLAQPDDWVSELFYLNFWAGSPLAHPILGRPEQVSAYGAEASRAFFRDTYRAPNLLITAAGGIDPAAFQALLDPVLVALPATDGTVAPPPNRPGGFLLNVPRKGLQQTSLLLGFPGPPHHHADRAAFGLLSQVLGGGMSSRLFMELRERRGLCYQVSAYPTPYRDSGALQIAASCAPENARELVKRALAECRKLATEGLPEEELERARLLARTSLVFGQESSSSRMFTLAHQAIQLGKVETVDEQMDEIRAVTVEQVQALAQRLLETEHLGLVALGTRKGAEIREKDLAA